MHQDAPTLELAVMVQSCLPGLGIHLTVPASYDPGLDRGCSTCREGAGSGQVGGGQGEPERPGLRERGLYGGWGAGLGGHGCRGARLEV